MDAALRLTGDRCECAACGWSFANLASFYAHRVHDRGHRHARVCRTAHELIAAAFTIDKSHAWRAPAPTPRHKDSQLPRAP
jgi:hypothetical protein